MNTTRATLLVRVRDRRDDAAWREFHDLYAPLLLRYARARGLSLTDAEEVRDQCLEIVARKIVSFEYDRSKGGFKSWLYRIASGKVIDLLRRKRERRADTQTIQRISDPEPTPDDMWESHWRNEHLRYCLHQVRDNVSEINYRAFHMLLFDDASTEDVCAALDLNANQVYKAKSRVLQRIREKLDQLGVEDEASPSIV